mgnify:FL=1
MRKSSEEIPGFYQWDFKDMVNTLPQKFPEPINMIEIGSYVGKSAVAWAEAFEQAGKDYSIYCIEAFTGIGTAGRASVMTPELEAFLDTLVCTAEEQEQRFIDNTKGWDNIRYEKNVFTADWEMVDMFEEYNVLWYDANHSEQSVTTAINYWKDKVHTMVIDCYDSIHPETMAAIDKSGLDFRLFEYNKGTKGIAVFG